MLNKYRKLLSLEDSLYRDRAINNARLSFIKTASSSPGYIDITLEDVNSNNEQIGILLHSSTNLYEKKFETVSNAIHIGSILKFPNEERWIVVSYDVNNPIVNQGEIYKCNHLLRFQDFDGNVVESWSVVDDPYNRYSQTYTMVNDIYAVLRIIVPYNENTAKLHVDKRLVLSKGFDKHGDVLPVVYKITSIKNQTLQYGSDNISLIEVARDVAGTSDSIDDMIADYETPQDNESVSSDKYELHIEGGSVVRIGGSARKLSARVTSLPESETRQPQSIRWSVLCEKSDAGILYSTDTNNYLYVSADNDLSLIGETIMVRCSVDIDDTVLECEKVLEVE